MFDRLPVFFAALWWGSLSAIGFVAVPMLFANLPQPAMAGFMAAVLRGRSLDEALRSGAKVAAEVVEVFEPWVKN